MARHRPTVHIFGGGTFSHVSPHLALAAPAFGTTAKLIARMIKSFEYDALAGDSPNVALARDIFPDHDIETVLTKMAAPERSSIVTNEDLSAYVDHIIEDPTTKVVFFTVAPVDFDGAVWTSSGPGPRGKDQPRLRTDVGPKLLYLTPTEKILTRIRQKRKDIFLVGFKTTAGASRDEQYLTGLKLLKSASCNLVLANDVHTRLNMVITPEQAAYHETSDREAAIKGLVEMAHHRSQGTFTRSKVEPGTPVPWDDPRVPESLRAVVNHCIARGAYKPFRGSTVGHFAVRQGGARDGSDSHFLTSRRKTDFNKLSEVGLVAVQALDNDQVIAYGSKPSVGGQSQRIIFEEHTDTDCIVHFHCPLEPTSEVPRRSQRENECGSHQCGKNTSQGLQRFELSNGQYLYAVMLDKHGPNIVFDRDVDPNAIIEFIEENFDLEGRTDCVSPNVAKAFEQSLSA